MWTPASHEELARYNHPHDLKLQLMDFSLSYVNEETENFSANFNHVKRAVVSDITRAQAVPGPNTNSQRLEKNAQEIAEKNDF